MSASTIAPTRFMTPDEVSAEIFGGAIAPERIPRLSKDRGLPSHRVGRRRMYLAEEVIAWARSRDGDGVVTTASATEGTAPAPSGAVAVDPAWVADQVAKFDAEALRRAGELLLALANSPAAEGGVA